MVSSPDLNDSMEQKLLKLSFDEAHRIVSEALPGPVKISTCCKKACLKELKY